MKNFLLGILALSVGSTLAAPHVNIAAHHPRRAVPAPTVTVTVTVNSCPPAPTPPASGPINPVGKTLNLGGGQTVTITAPHQTVTSTQGAALPTQTLYIFDAGQFIDQSQNTNGKL